LDEETNEIENKTTSEAEEIIQNLKEFSEDLLE